MSSPGQPPNILAVDDTPANLRLLGGMLRDKGYRVRPVASGAEALQAAAAEPPDLILLDIGMPELDGFEVCRRLKANPTLQDVPVIFLTAHTDSEHKVKAFACGAVDFVTKPFSFDEVNARVGTHLELRRQRRELQASYEKLCESETLRDSLVHMVVHDLRSPLTVLVAGLDFLKRDTGAVLSTTQREVVEDSLVAARKMVAQVSSMLDVSKLDAGKLVPQRVECDLVLLATDVVRSLGALAVDKRLTLAPPQHPIWAVVDKELVSRVTQNLLSNALKFTPTEGAIEVGVEGKPEAVRVWVKDSGPGIPLEQRGQVFDEFSQVRTEASSAHNWSTGLGLAFCKLAVEAHGGAIGVDSEVGKGSTFWFELPRGAPAGPSRSQEA